MATLVAALALSAAVGAQFGHPLKGQWSGQWGPGDTRLLVDLQWDGKNITGVINPGPNAAIVKSVTIDYTNPAAWGVTIQADGTDESGKPVSIVADGTLENIGAYNKVLRGNWTQGDQKGKFLLTRN